MNIYVGNLPADVTEEELKRAFEAYGKVEKVTIIKDKFTGLARGFGFVEIPNQAEAKAAIEGMNGKEFKGKNLTVNEARPRSDDRKSGYRDRDRPRGGFGNKRGFKRY